MKIAEQIKRHIWELKQMKLDLKMIKLMSK